MTIDDIKAEQSMDSVLKLADECEDILYRSTKNLRLAVSMVERYGPTMELLYKSEVLADALDSVSGELEDTLDRVMSQHADLESTLADIREYILKGYGDDCR